jgi:hypothetical protein
MKMMGSEPKGGGDAGGSRRAGVLRAAGVRRFAVVAGFVLAWGAGAHWGPEFARAAPSTEVPPEGAEPQEPGGGNLTVKASGEWGPIEIRGQSIPPGQARKMTFGLRKTFAGAFLDAPLLVVRGARPGPTLCVFGGIHGDELNGVEIAYRVFHHVKP